MNTLQIDCFLAAAKYLNFSKAANSLFVSQPTLSRNISLLEKELKMQLFVRNSFQGIHLTEAGAYMLNSFQQAKTLITQSVTYARLASDTEYYQLTIGILEGQMIDDKLCDLLKSFRKENPNVVYKIVRSSFQTLISQLNEDSLDIITTLDHDFQNRENLIVQPIYQLPTILVIPKSTPLKNGPDELYSLADFSHLPFICVNKDGSAFTIDLLHQACAEAGFEPNIIYADTLQEESLMLEMGAGIAGINTYHSICYSPNITYVRVKEFVPQSFSLACKKQSINPAVSIFKNFFTNWSKTHKFFG